MVPVYCGIYPKYSDYLTLEAPTKFVADILKWAFKIYFLYLFRDIPRK